MAKKKKTTKHRTTRRRRRVSGLGSGLDHDGMEVLGLIAGNVASVVAQRQMTSISPKIVSGAQLVGGFMLKKHAKSPFMSGVGYGLMSAGAIGLTHDFGILHGVEEFVNGIAGGGSTYLETTDMSGLNNNQTMTGLGNGQTMAGGYYEQVITEM